MSKPRTIAEYPNRADDYDQAVSKSHDQNTDTALDQGGDNEVTAEDIRGHVDSAENPHQVTAGQVGAYTKGESDDLLNDKADQSALNATNQAVSVNTGNIEELQGRFETGTWPMQLIGTEGGSVNFTATYSRVGNMVNVIGFVTVTPPLPFTGDYIFTGLGYNVVSNNSYNICRHGNNINYPPGGNVLMQGGVTDSDQVEIYFMGPGGIQRMNNTHQADGSVFRLSLTYITNDPFDS